MPRTQRARHVGDRLRRSPTCPIPPEPRCLRFSRFKHIIQFLFVAPLRAVLRKFLPTRLTRASASLIDETAHRLSPDRPHPSRNSGVRSRGRLPRSARLGGPLALATIVAVASLLAQDKSVPSDNQGPLAPEVRASFAGIPDTGAFPPSPSIAVGPDHVLQAVNSSMLMTSKSGGVLASNPFSTFPFASFDLSGSKAPFDPKVVYDHFASRFVMMVVNKDTASGVSNYLFAVSLSSDPMSSLGWCPYALRADVNGTSSSGNWADNAQLGFDDTNFYITSNQYGFASGTFAYAKLRVMAKSQFYASTTSCSAPAWVDFWGTDFTDAPFGLVPARTFGTPGVEYIVNSSSASSGASLNVRTVSGTWPNGSNTLPVLSAATSVAVDAYSAPVDAPSSGSTTPVDTGDARLLNAVYRNGALYTAHTVGAPCFGATSSSCARFYRVAVGGTPSVSIQESVGSPGLFSFYPAVEPDPSGNVFLVFSRTGPGQFVESRYAVRLTTDSAAQASGQLQAGVAAYTRLDTTGSNRWGAYGGAAVDPADGTVWVTHANAAFPANTWRTRIAKLSLALPGAFSKTSPANGATGQQVSNPTLSWGASPGATSYETCIDTTNDDACSVWVNRGLSTIVGIFGLHASTTYYWHVRANNANGATYANGSSTAFWSFTTVNTPGEFGKISPADGATGQSVGVTLTWGASATAASYDYCLDTSNNNACDAPWLSAGSATSVWVSGLAVNTPYYWHVRAVNTAGTTYAEGSATAFFGFTIGVAGPPCTWSAAPAFPIPILDEAVTSVGGNLYAFAGQSSGGYIANVYKFDGATWTPKASYPAAVGLPAAVTDGTNVFIMGGVTSSGFTSVPQKTLYRYNVAADTYTPLAPFTTATWNHAAVYLNGKIYKFAGTGPATASTNALEIYDVATNVWSAGATYPLSVSFVSAFAQGNFIYAAGGLASAGSVTTAKTYRYDPATNVWDDAAMADLPGPRWGGAGAFVGSHGVVAGGHVGPSLSSSAVTWDLASNTWSTAGDMLGARRRMSGAVLSGNFHVIGGASSGSSFTNDNQLGTCTGPNIAASAGTLTGENIPNGGLDPGEVVTVSLCVANAGFATSGGVTGTLAATGGVTSPSGAQVYGAVAAGATVCKSYTFTVSASCGTQVIPTLGITEVGGASKNVTYSFRVGTPVVNSVFSQNFDGVVAPALPAGWTTTNAGGGSPALWVTNTTAPDTAPARAFTNDPATAGESEMTTPTIIMPAGASTLTFRNSYVTESAYDGGVLEISIAGGPFTDILAAGGSFVSGGYNSTISATDGNPLAGRAAWTGTSAGYITTTANLPAGASSQSIRLRWRMGSDGGVAGTGWAIDTITVTATTYMCGVQNDTFANALVIGQVPYQSVVSTADATTGAEDPWVVCDNESTERSVWYLFTPAVDGPVRVNTFGSNYNTLLAVFTGSPGNFSWVRCNNDADSTPQSSLIVQGTAGQRLAILVTSYSGTGGSLTLNVAHVPVAFSKVGPADGATAQSLGPTLSWGASSGAASYEYCIDTINDSWCNSNWVSVGTAISVGLSGLAPSTTYYWHVRALNGIGDTTYSNASETTFWSFATGLFTPGAPTITGITAGNGQLSVAFTAGTTGGSALTNYEYSINGGANFTARSPAATTSPLVITGLTNGTTYTVRIRAVNAQGAGAMSAWVMGTPSALPAAPNDTFANAIVISAVPYQSAVNTYDTTTTAEDPAVMCGGGSTLRSVWYVITPSLDGPISMNTFGSSYDTILSVYTGSPGSFVPVDCSDDTDSTLQSALIIQGVAGQRLAILVTSLSASGGDLTLHVGNLPGAPTITGITAGNGQLSVAFTAGSTGGSALTNYEYSIDLGGQSFAARAPAATSSPLVIAGLINETTYTVRLRAVNESGAGSASASRMGTPSATPAAPNDAFANATVINAVPYQSVVNTYDATKSADDPIASCPGGSAEKTVWYLFTPSADGPVEVNTLGSSYDTVLSVYTGSPGSFAQAGCNDDAHETEQSSLIIQGQAGQRLAILVSSYQGPGGILILNVRSIPSPLVYLDSDTRGDALLYDPATGDWSRQISLADGGFVEQNQGSWAPGWSVLPARFNADALTDFFLYNTTTGQWAKMLNSGTAFAIESTGGWWPGWQRFAMDLDGDGISDFFLYDPATGVWFKCVSTQTGFTYQQGGWNPGWELYPMTLNGDALGDLFLVSRTTGRWFWVLGQNGPGFTYPVTETWFPGWQFYPGDFNGDGLTDILLHDPPTGIYFVATNTGPGFTYVQGGWSLGWQPYVADFNADGRDDLFLHDPATGMWFEMISNGLGHFTNAGSQTWSLGWTLSPTDVNGDSRADIVLYDPLTGVWYQARNLVSGMFTYNSGTWAPGLTIITRTPIR